MDVKIDGNSNVSNTGSMGNMTITHNHRNECKKLIQIIEDKDLFIENREKIIRERDDIIREKESRIVELLYIYKEHIYEKDKQIQQIISSSYRRNEVKISMLRDKDIIISKLVDENSALRMHISALTDRIFKIIDK